MPDARETILVVDDNEAERYYVSRVLSKAGFAVARGRHRPGGAPVGRVEPPRSLVTLDIRLPDLNGLEVCRRLKGNPATRDVPVLHISASFTSPENKAEGLDGGADGYLTHPVDPTELRRHGALPAPRPPGGGPGSRRRPRVDHHVRPHQRRGLPHRATATTSCAATPRSPGCSAALPEMIGRRLHELVPELARAATDPAAGVRTSGWAGRHFRRAASTRAKTRHGAGDAGLGAGRHHRAAAAARRRSGGARTRPRRGCGEIEAVYSSAPVGLCVLDHELRYVRAQRADGRDDRAPGGGSSSDGPCARSVPGARRRGGAQAPAGAGHGRAGLQRSRSAGATDGSAGCRARVGGDLAPAARRRRADHRHQRRRGRGDRAPPAAGKADGGAPPRGGRPARRRRGARDQQPDDGGAGVRGLRPPASRRCRRPVRADIEQIRQAAERTARITAQLLAFGRRQHLQPEVVDLDAVVERLRPVPRPRTGRPDCTLQLEPGSLGQRGPGRRGPARADRCSTSRSTPATPCPRAAPSRSARRPRHVPAYSAGRSRRRGPARRVREPRRRRTPATG